MSAYDLYYGSGVKAARKSWWNPFSWWPSDDPEPAPDAEVEDPDFWQQPVTQELVQQVEEINRQLEATDDQAERRRLRKERKLLLERIQSLETTWMKLQSRDGRSAG